MVVCIDRKQQAICFALCNFAKSLWQVYRAQWPACDAMCTLSHVTRHTGHNNNKVSRQPTLHTGHPGGLQLVRIHKNYVMSFVGLLQFIPITESQNHFWGCVTCGLCFCFWSKALASFKSFVSNVRNEGSKRLDKVPVCSVELVTALDPPHN